MESEAKDDDPSELDARESVTADVNVPFSTAPASSRSPSSSASSVCFFCLKRRNKSNKSNVKIEDNLEPPLSGRFLYFCQQYLKVETIPGNLFNDNEGKTWGVELAQRQFKLGSGSESDFEGKAKFELCQQCEKLLSSLLNVYKEITALRARLLWSVGQLGEVLRQSTKRKSSFMKELLSFREEIEEKCRSKAQIIQPEVAVVIDKTELSPRKVSRSTPSTTMTTTRSGRKVKKPRFSDVDVDDLIEDIDPPDPFPEFEHPTSDYDDHGSVDMKAIPEKSKASSNSKTSKKPPPKRIASAAATRSRTRRILQQNRIGQALQKRLIRGRKINSAANGAPVSVRVTSHSCSHCDSEFRNRLQLLQHMAMVHEGLADEFLTCTVCLKLQDGFYELQKHLEEKHEDPNVKPIYCVFCYQSFTTQQLSDLHRREQHSKVYLARCPLLFCDKDDCPEKFMSVIDLNKHLKTHITPEDEEGVFVCPKCGRGFLNSTRCELHQILHLQKDGEGFYHCPDFESCQIKLKGQRKLLNHYNKKHVDINRRLTLHPCDLCKKRPYFISRKDLETHSKRHALELQCRICGEVCLGSNELMVHKYNKHPEDFNFNQMPKPNPKELSENEKVLKEELEDEEETKTSGLLRKCVYCPQKFLTFAELEKHKAQEHGINANRPQPGRLVCDICGLVVSYKGTLARHMLTHSEPTIECPYKCGKMFRRAGNMEMHVLKSHKRGEFEPQFVCDICGRGYLSRGLLNRHKKEHEKLIKCSICSKMLRTTSRLKEHLRATHSSERFNCNWCTSVYTWETKLIAHVKKKHPEHYDEYYASRVKWRSLTKVDDDNEAEEEVIGQSSTDVFGDENQTENIAQLTEEVVQVIGAFSEDGKVEGIKNVVEIKQEEMQF